MNGQKEEPKRDRRIDMLKGIAVLCVIWGHVIQALSADTMDFFENPVFKVIYSFHMPLFMLISGYLFYGSLGKRSLGQMIKNRITRLLLPILVWNTLNYIVHIVVSLLYTQSCQISLGGYLDALRNLWFLWAVLAASLIVAVIVKKVPKKMRIPAMIFGSVFLLVFPYRWQIVWMYPYFIIGYYFCEYKARIAEKIKRIQLGAVVLYLIMIFFYEKKHYIYISEISPLHSAYGFGGQIAIDLYRWVIGLAGSIAMTIPVNVAVQLEQRKVLTKILHMLEELGMHSLQIYVIQAIVLEYIFSFFYSEFVTIVGKNYLGEHILLFQIIVAPLLSVFLSALLNKLVQLLGRIQLFKKLLFQS